MKKLFHFSLILIIILLAGSFKVPKKSSEVKTIVIDAGHGGKDPGTHGEEVEEKVITLEVAKKVGELIKAQTGMKVIYTRTKNEFVELHDRATIANKAEADLFISIHCNALSRPEVHGTETYVMGVSKTSENLEVAKRENSAVLLEKDYLDNYGGFDPNSPVGHIMFANYQNAYIENSLKFAKKVEDNFKFNLKKHSRGVKQETFIVLWKTAMPSALIEIGYLTNKEEEKKLLNSDNQLDIAAAIVLAVKDYKEEVENQD